MANSKPVKLKIILPVLFTFGATLALSQATAMADTTTPETNGQAGTQQAVLVGNQNPAQSQAQVQASQRLTMAMPAGQTAVAPKASQSLPNVPGAVSVNAGNAQAAAQKPVIDTRPSYSTGQYQVSAQPVNPNSGASGNVRLNLSGLSGYQQNFVNSLHDGAIQSWRQYGVLPSVTAAQAIIESGWGQSVLASQYHNLFGIKGSYNGHSVMMPTREVYGGRSVMINDAFRAYANNSESVADHGAFLANNSRYHNLLWQTDYHTVTYLIRADGYATDPNYTATLNSVIQRYGLNAWDNEAMTINNGYIDDLSVRGGQLHISGWHATTNYNGSMHHFIIVLDANTHQELYRTEVPGVYRQDVQNVYPSVAISGWGGFDLSIPYSATFANRNLQVVSRYTYNGNGEPNGGQDLYYQPVATSSNVGCLDQMSIDANTGAINISGWHAADASLNKNYHFIIIYDASKHVELGRYLVNTTTRNDVAKVYNVYNAAKSGFSLKLNYNPALAGDQIQVISRYSDNQSGEGHYVDYWFAPKTFNRNEAYLDNFSVQGRQLHVSGWNANDQSIGRPYHYLILFDATTGREVKRQLVSTTNRSDVARVVPNVYNSGKCGFDWTTTSLSPSLNGHQLQVISRYSNNPTGEGNYVDFWFAPIKVNIK